MKKSADMFLTSLKLDNFLSFGKSEAAVEMRPLNLIIGPNGSGKSNFIEALSLLHSAPSTSTQLNLPATISRGEGVGEWIWKGKKDEENASIEATFHNPYGKTDLRYVLGFTESNLRFKIDEERVENAEANKGNKNPHFYYRFKDGKAFLNAKDGRKKKPDIGDFKPNVSILSQRKDPDQFREMTYLGDKFEEMRLYRDWHFGPGSDVRLPQKTDMPNDYLDIKAKNLYLVLSRLLNDLSVESRILDALGSLYKDIDRVRIRIDGGTVQAVFQEGENVIPASRFSDGTLRFLCLLVVLLDPNPPAPLVCIEEPELGLHPDVLSTVAKLLVEASKRTQLVVTTHSEALVDAMTDQPESVLVADRDENGTQLRRLAGKNGRPSPSCHVRSNSRSMSASFNSTNVGRP